MSRVKVTEVINYGLKDWVQFSRGAKFSIPKRRGCLCKYP